MPRQSSISSASDIRLSALRQPSAARSASDIRFSDSSAARSAFNIRFSDSSVVHSVPESVPMIDIRCVVKSFKNAAGEFTVLKGVDLQIGRGDFVSIIGKSGSGKSTLLNMMTGIDHPTSGQVIVNGQDLYKSLDESGRSLWRGRNLGIVFQFFQLLQIGRAHV